MTLGERIKAARLHAGITSTKGLGDLVGKAQATISDWELDKYEPSLEMLARVARATDVSPAWLILDLGGMLDAVAAPLDTPRFDRDLMRKAVALAEALPEYKRFQTVDRRADTISSAYEILMAMGGDVARTADRLREIRKLGKAS